MGYDERLAERVRRLLRAVDGVEERRMFGGLSFLVNGHMCCGVLEDRLMLRLGEELAREALLREHASPMDFTGKPLKSMVFVSAAGLAADPDLRRWIDEAVAFAGSLPPKCTRGGSS